MIESVIHCFPSNFWRNKITNNKKSDKCDLCKELWKSLWKGRFTTEGTLPIQTLGHIQHTCEALSELHTMTHHRCWRLIHGELSHLAPSKWCFVCINNEKYFRTVWQELDQEFPVVFELCSEQTLWNVGRDTEMRRPLTQAEERRRKSGIPQEEIAQDSLWNKRPHGVAFKMPTETQTGVICLLEFKRMSDVTSHYIVRGKSETETQYSYLRSGLAMTIQCQSWKVEQVIFITGVRSFNEEELKKDLTFFEVPSVSIEPIHTKLVMKIFDEYANIQKGMHSIRYNGRSDHGGTSVRPVHGRSNHGDVKGRGIINICFFYV
jgi:hypothetical protein